MQAILGPHHHTLRARAINLILIFIITIAVTQHIIPSIIPNTLA
jgi:hypothetical protein